MTRAASPRPADGSPPRLGIVSPWYGEGCEGGAERLLRGLAERLAERGVWVEAFASAGEGFLADWGVAARPRRERLHGVLVHRFPVEAREEGSYARIDAKAAFGRALTAGELWDHERQMIRCDGVAREVARRRADLDLFLLGPYLFSTTLQAARACPGQAVLVPCLHDEPQARLPPYRALMAEARGVLFNSAAEWALGRRLYGLPDDRAALVGGGVELALGDAGAFRRRHGERELFLYVGRRDEAKGFPLLLDHFRRYRRLRPGAQLAVVGPGEVLATEEGILDLGRLNEAEKRDALAAATALLQPSRLESFSFVCLESWAQGRPVIVHGGCRVTREAVVASGGGLYFETFREFAAACDRLSGDRALAARLGRSGQAWVRAHHGWPQAVGRCLRALQRLAPERFKAPFEPPPEPLTWRGGRGL